MFWQFGPRDQTPVILQLFVGPPATHYAPSDRLGWRVGFTCHPGCRRACSMGARIWSWDGNRRRPAGQTLTELGISSRAGRMQGWPETNQHVGESQTSCETMNVGDPIEMFLSVVTS